MMCNERREKKKNELMIITFARHSNWGQQPQNTYSNMLCNKADNKLFINHSFHMTI